MRAVIVNGQILREDGQDRVDAEGRLPGKLVRSSWREPEEFGLEFKGPRVHGV
jgi:hypothetical protein